MNWWHEGQFYGGKYALVYTFMTIVGQLQCAEAKFFCWLVRENHWLAIINYR